MSRHDRDTGPGPWWGAREVRGKPVTFTRHALAGMDGERIAIGMDELLRVLEEPDHDDGKEARKWVGWRTIKVYYREEARHLWVLAASATRRRLPP